MKRSNLPFGVYNLVLCGLVVCAVVLLCLCAEEAEERYYLKWDVSDDRVSALSDDTMSRLSALDSAVTVCPVYTPGNSTSLRDLQTETLLRMAAACDDVTVDPINPDTQPQRLRSLAGEAEGIPDGTILIHSEATGRTLRLAPDDFLFSRRLGNEIYTIYCGEALLIGAIDRVTAPNPGTVWFVTGHGEATREDCAQWTLQLQAMGFGISSGALGMIQPDDADVLMMLDPRTDLTQAEAAHLTAFLDGGGKLIIACGADTPLDRMPELAYVMDLYGLGFRAGWVVEAPGAAERYVDRPELVSPALSDTQVMASLPGRLIMPRSCALSVPSMRPGITAKTLLVTSSGAVLKQNVQGDAYTDDAGDASGTMALAVLASSGDMRILQLASADMLRDDQALTGATVLDASENLTFAAACLKHMTGEDSEATLAAGVKQLPAQLITFDSQQTRQRVSVLLLTALPGCILLIMLIVLLRRRRL
ncbi:MAG: Gldg family protein [Aristaeellaceae bacterium]